MNFLTPLYAMAALAIAVPVFLHLVRKRPKDRQTFSSLMFLDEASPRLTNHSRIENWLLLALRALAIALLAFAFSRPYWNWAAESETSTLGSQRVILLDCSASMQRDGMIAQAQTRIRTLVEQSKATDSVAAYAFDQTLRPLLSIEEAAKVVPSQRQQTAVAAFQNAKPTWNATDLGSCLVQLVEILQTEKESSDTDQIITNEIVIVTDFQSGMKLDTLANFAWPTNTRVRIERIEPLVKGNAHLTFLSESSVEESPTLPQASGPNLVRARVFNSANSPSSAFQLSWRNKQNERIGDETKCNVPAGSSLVVAMPAASDDCVLLQLDGDWPDFDNKQYVAPKLTSTSSVLVVESKSLENEASLGYFVSQMPLSTPTCTVSIENREPGSPVDWPSPVTTPWIIAASKIQDRDVKGLTNYMETGGQVLWVMDDPVTNETGASSMEVTGRLGQLAGAVTEVQEATVNSYAMLERIDFRHPVFADLADSRFNDFTKIKFWSHRRLTLPEESGWQTLAHFDDGSPALLARPRGKGVLWVLAAGWQPSQSQLALSSKFVPIISNLYRLAAKQDQEVEMLTVGDEIAWNQEERIVDPTGQDLVSSSSSTSGLSGGRCRLDRPGIYQRLQNGQWMQSMAVNMAESESAIESADLECLERLGVNMQDSISSDQKERQQRQLQAVEMEAQQGWWRWLVIGVLGVSGTESLVCILRSRSK